MAKGIHELLGWVSGAIIAVLTGAVTFGGESVRQKIVDIASRIYADTASLTALICVVIAWAIAWFSTKQATIRWLKSLRRPVPAIYLYNTDLVSPHGDKSYVIKWIAEFLSISFRGDSANPLTTDPIKEGDLTFALFNADDVDIRHIEARWLLPGIDTLTLVQRSGLFDAAFQGINSQGAIKLESKAPNQGRGALLPQSTDVQGPPLPVIKGGETVPIMAPRAFTSAYAIAALVKAKTIPRTPLRANAISPLKILENISVPADVAEVRISYFKGDKRHSRTFRITGQVYGGNQPLIHSPTNDEPNRYEAVEGLVACVANVTVMAND